MTAPDTRFTWRHQYDDAADAVQRANTDIGDLGPSMTQQHFAKDADLNEIVRRFGIAEGAIPPVPIDPQYYGDFTDVPDFRQALDNTREAIQRFDALPATLRNRFNNDPVALWDFVTNPANTDEAITLGLLRKTATDAPAPPVLPEA